MYHTQGPSRKGDRLVVDTTPSVRQKSGPGQRDFWDSLLDEGSEDGGDEDNWEARLQSLKHIKVAHVPVPSGIIEQTQSESLLHLLKDFCRCTCLAKGVLGTRN